MSKGNRIFFVIPSIGQSGTRWLSKSLNAHDDIVCVHGGSEITPSEYNDNENEFLHDPALIKEKMLGVRKEKICGVIHRHNSTTLSWFKPLSALDTPPLISIRHPVSRILSYANTIYKNPDHGVNRENFSMYEGEFQKFCKLEKLDENSYDNRNFYYAIKKMGMYVHDYIDAVIKLNAEIKQFIQMERYTKDPEYFSWIVDYISKGEIMVSGAYLERVFDENEAPNPNNQLSHTLSLGRKKYLSAAIQFDHLKTWQQNLLRRELDPQISQIPELYERFGYSFSFLR